MSIVFNFIYCACVIHFCCKMFVLFRAEKDAFPHGIIVDLGLN